MITSTVSINNSYMTTFVDTTSTGTLTSKILSTSTSTASAAINISTNTLAIPSDDTGII